MGSRALRTQLYPRAALRTAVALAGVGLILPLSVDAGVSAIYVQNGTEFAAAVSALRDTGGTIRLRRNTYGGELVVRSRSAKPLHIVGERGVRVESLLLEQTQHVSVSRLTIAPARQDAWLRVSASRFIDVRDILVTAQRTRYRATVQVSGSSQVGIRRSEFRHCGDRSPLFSNCLHLKNGTRHIRIVDNWFHDCRGCDFIHGRFGYDVTLRGNRFERALPCRMNRDRCGHQDLVSFWSGNRRDRTKNLRGLRPGPRSSDGAGAVGGEKVSRDRHKAPDGPGWGVGGREGRASPAGSAEQTPPGGARGTRARYG